jgi:hypothetical protein
MEESGWMENVSSFIDEADMAKESVRSEMNELRCMLYSKS